MIPQVTVGQIIDPTTFGNAVIDSLNYLNHNSNTVEQFASDTFTAQSGWTVETITRGYRIGPFAYIRAQATRTGGTITVPATGDIANTNIMTAPAGLQSSLAQAFGMGPYSTGRMCGGQYYPPTGMVLIANTTPGVNIVDTDVISLAGFFFLG